MKIKPLKGFDFKRVLENGIRRSKHGLVCYVLQDGNDTPAIGISVKKAIGTAVVRNRIKRRIRGWLQEIPDALLPGQKAVLIIRPVVLPYTRREFKAYITALFGRSAVAQ